MRSRFLLLSTLLAAQICLVPFCLANQVFIPERFKGIILNAPEPYYPHGIERNLIRGQSIFRLKIDKQTGKVEEVQVLMRTGIRRLDADAILTFMKWRFRPGTISQIEFSVVYDYQIEVKLKNAGFK